MEIYIEKLTFWNLFEVFFRILIQINRVKAKQKINISYIDGTFISTSLAQRIGSLLGWKVSQLSFELMDIREENSGEIIRVSIPYDYLWKVKKYLQQQYTEIFQRTYKNNLDLYIEKSTLYPSILSPGSLSRVIYMYHVIAEDMKQQEVDNCLLLMFDHAWKQSVQVYAQKLGIQIHYIKHFYPIKQLPSIQNNSRTMGQLLKNHAKELGIMLVPNYVLWARNYWERLRIGPVPVVKDTLVDGSSKIAVFGKGALNFKNDGLFSDLFFTFQSSLKKEKLVLLRVQGTEDTIKHLNQHNVSYCCMTPPRYRVEGLNYYSGPQKIPNIEYKQYKGSDQLSTLERRWLKYHQVEYLYRKSYWKEFAHQQNIKVFHTWYKYEADHIAVTEALRETGGVMSIWQLPFEEIPNVECIISTDIAFCFSTRWSGNAERLQGSKILYHVSTGFLGVNCELLRPKALELRQQLHAKGVQKIIACFDENSLDDSRWHQGHKVQRENYRLLLEKVLRHPWLGVIFKPKQPRTLRKRLGDVAILLEDAEQTGRCMVLETSTPYASNIPPVLAGLVADVAIQGHMNAGTTALECALAGIPTLSVDRECFHRSRLYELGEGQVVFRSYEDLWETLQEHWNSPAGVPGLGDWSPLLEELDPFRDGRGAERMGTYLRWLIQGFDQGLDRDTIMADAAGKYCKQWGHDKIQSIG